MYLIIFMISIRQALYFIQGALPKFITIAVFGVVFLAYQVAQAAQGSLVYTYDGRGRLASVTYEDGKTIAYTYDAAGNRVREVVTVPASAIAAEARQEDVGG